MTSVLGRMAACSGQEITWDDAVNNGRAEFPLESVTSWDQVPPVLPDTEPPVQPAEGEMIYENSVPMPGQWKWNA